VFDELCDRKAEVDRLRRAQVERARDDADLAQRQFMLVRPEHRLVADTVEQQWNEKFAQLAALEEEYTRLTKTDASEFSGHDHERIQALVADPRDHDAPIFLITMDRRAHQSGISSRASRPPRASMAAVWRGLGRGTVRIAPTRRPERRSRDLAVREYLVELVYAPCRVPCPHCGIARGARAVGR
jgi:hypothetical protein